MLRILPAAIVFVACSSTASSPAADAGKAGASCAARSGSYEMTYVPQTPAACPALPPGLPTSESPAALGEGTTQLNGGGTNVGSTTADNCTVTFDTSQPAGESRGSVTWNADATAGTGTEELLPTGQPGCIYNVSVTKQ